MCLAGTSGMRTAWVSMWVIFMIYLGLCCGDSPNKPVRTLHACVVDSPVQESPIGVPERSRGEELEPWLYSHARKVA
jgi:hypothetical protein